MRWRKPRRAGEIMSIDWITVAAQIANFLVLVWLLKRFLYRPILDGIDAREAEITERMTAATRAKDEAVAAKAAYEAKRAALASEQAQIAEAARHEAQQERDALLAEAHDRIDRERAAWQAHQDAEAHRFATKLQRAGGHALLEMTRKAVRDLAETSLEAQMAAHIGTQLAAMKDDLTHAAGEAQEAIITSHMSLPEAAQDAFRTELAQHFPQVAPRFETDPAQAPGVAVQLGGAQVVWTVDSYIEGLGAALNEHLSRSHDTRLGVA